MDNWDCAIDGYPLTVRDDIFVESVEFGEPSESNQDSDNPVGPGRFFGRDVVAGRTLKVTMHVNRTDAKTARKSLADLGQVWGQDYGPGDESVFRYRLGDEHMRVYGRCRKFNPDADAALRGGGAKVEAEFKTSDPYFYSDGQRKVRTDLTPSQYSDLTFPVTFPITFATTGTRSGIIEDTSGNAPAPFQVMVHGPFQHATVSGKGWSIDLATELESDRSVTVDTRKMTVLRDDGVSLAGDLSRKTFLADCRLRPGQKDEFKFDATDSSNRAYAELSWRPTWTSF